MLSKLRVAFGKRDGNVNIKKTEDPRFGQEQKVLDRQKCEEYKDFNSINSIETLKIVP